MNKNLLWLIPVILLGMCAGLVLSLPGFVASATHRPAIEALASSLTGRQVRIRGTLSLDLLPAPEIIAGNVTITGSDHETITARSLTMDISLAALLRGQLSIDNLTLDHPSIAFPWPLPNGPRAIAPPRWLAALHAQIAQGDVSLGAAKFSGVDADLFTGANGTVSISGTGAIAGQTLDLSMALGATALTGAAPLTVDASSGAVSLHFSGSLTGESALTGQLNLASPAFNGGASIIAGGASVTANALQGTAGKANITGTATFSFVQPKLTADLTLANFDTSQLQALPAWPPLPVSLTLLATNLARNGQTIPALQTSLDISPNLATIHTLTLTLPGSSTVSANFTLTPSGALAGQASLASPDLPDLLQNFDASAPPGWRGADLSATLAGNTSAMSLQNIAGGIDTNQVAGTLVISGQAVNGALSFGQLDLAPMLAWASHASPGVSFDGQITARHATLGTIPLENLLLDGQFGRNINIRRISANLYNGITAGSLALDAAGQISAASLFLALPSAAPLAAAWHGAWQPPAALVQPRLAASLTAAGPPDALATSLTATLGDFTLTAGPVLDLTTQSAAGPLTLRDPSAIAALKLFGLGASGPTEAAGCGAVPPAPPSGLDISARRLRVDCATLYRTFSGGGLAWPGPGSLSLRADMTAAAQNFGLPNFVLSLGQLTAAGRLVSNHGVIAGDIAASTLAIPPIPADLPIPWDALASANGAITLAAAQVTYAGNGILGPSRAHLTLAPNKLTAALTSASLAGGNLTGTLTASTAASKAPALALSLTASQLNSAALAVPLAFPYTLPTGTLALQANLTASGYSPKIWAATLAGTATLTAASGTINGFSLQNLGPALTAPDRTTKLRAALAKGATRFTTLTLATTTAQGNCTLTTASLASPEGTATATGSIDLFDQDFALNLAFTPAVTPPLTIHETVIGPWGTPVRIPRLRPAEAWKPESK